MLVLMPVLAALGLALLVVLVCEGNIRIFVRGRPQERGWTVALRMAEVVAAVVLLAVGVRDAVR